MATYKIDPVHSLIGFKVKHLMISTVNGKFDQFDATIESDKPDFSNLKVYFEAKTNSINTNNEQRDAHLQSPDFLHAEKYPVLSFLSTGVEKHNEETFVLKGDLSLRGVTKPVALNVIFNGITNAWDESRAGFEASAKISRKDFGLSWNNVTEAGGLIVGDEVQIQLEAEFVKQA